MTQSSVLERLKEIKGELKEKYRILKIGLFGSYSKGTATESSDIDLIYVLEDKTKMGLKELYDLEQFFKELFGKNKVDLINSKYINPIIAEDIENSIIYV